MIYLAWALTVIAAFLLGFHMKSIKLRVEVLEKEVKKKVSRPKEVPEPPSELIDPTDPIAEARYQQEKLMKDLNRIDNE